MDRHLAFITYETPIAPGGGIAAVMAHLPRAMQSVSQIPTFVITPFHYKIKKTAELEREMDIITTLNLAFGSAHIKVDVMLFNDGISWIFLKPLSLNQPAKRFFSGERHPYDLPPNGPDGVSDLGRDALLFGKAASAALLEICPECRWTVFLQDWEAATFVLSNLQDSQFRKIEIPYLVLHNSYDFGISPELSNNFGLDSLPVTGDTVLDNAIDRVQDPIFTVSEQFALDLSGEIFQYAIMIPHIVDKLKPRLVGINNGPFISSQIPELVFQAAQEGDIFPLADWKDQRRIEARSIIRDFTPGDDKPVWGDTQKFSQAGLPWFVMAGRDDSRQKGYELACLAIESFLQQKGEAGFIFFPIPGDEGLQGIQFIQELAQIFPENVLCFPFLFREGYFPIMQGANFGMMPSYYEPFGMANEYFLNGLSCIGRATGGIIQQIIPDQNAASFNSAVSSRSIRWHNTTSKPSGFLFRENDGIDSALDDWKEIDAAQYKPDQPGKNRLKTRGDLKLVKEISNEFSRCITDAVELYEMHREEYYQFIINGAQYILDNFSWEITAKKYIEFVEDFDL